MPTIAIQDDHIIRVLSVVLDPDCPKERADGFADYYSVDMPEFPKWCEEIRARYPAAYPSKVLLAKSEEEFRSMLPEADLVVTEDYPIGEAELAIAPRLKFVQGFGSDTRNIDEAACAARGIGTAPLHRRVNTAVAEHAFALLMTLAKKITETNKLLTVEALQAKGWPARVYDRRHTANSNWARVSGIMNLRGATLGIVGLGSIGRDVARWGNAFGMKVIYTQRNPLSAELEAAFGATFAPMDDLLAQSDAISLHVPMNESTRGLIDAGRFAKMKQGAILIDVSRAEVIDRDALLDAMKSGKLGGLGMDVHYKEPVDADDPLLAFDNVALSPHIAIGTRVNGAEDVEEMVANLAGAMK
ncbi:MAG: D-glycerate dehydrogenase [Alphaproteobacteria bacterium]|nr:D-glycerate dehydrogenase [Alphaproteobacteria bacterium]MPY70383.1 D-glycerate dehydrogenase [Alphaproteobacteria bacterium]